MVIPQISIEFPIVIEKETEEEKKKEKIEAPKIEGDSLIALIKIVHGSYWPIWKIRDALQLLYPKIPARTIKKKVVAIAMKEKGTKDSKVLIYLINRNDTM